jgi:hypothetical protein
MGSLRSMQIVWDDLLDAFNSDDAVIYFLDRESGEVFFVPTGYEDGDFWAEMGRHRQRYLRIPTYDYEQERYLVYQFIQQLDDAALKGIMERAFAGKESFGKLDDILEFYPDEQERLFRMKDEVMSGRIKHWLEEHDLYPDLSGGPF